MQRARIRYDTPIFVETYNGWDIFKQHPSKGHGYDPVFVIYYTQSTTGKRKYEHFAYDLDEIKKQIGNRSNRVRLTRKRPKFSRK